MRREISLRPETVPWTPIDGQLKRLNAWTVLQHTTD